MRCHSSHKQDRDKSDGRTRTGGTRSTDLALRVVSVRAEGADCAARRNDMTVLLRRADDRQVYLSAAADAEDALVPERGGAGLRAGQAA